MKGRARLAGILFDVVAVIMTGTAYGLLETGLVSTAHTGFYSADESLMAPYLPYENDTISASAVAIVAVILGLLVIAVEFSTEAFENKGVYRKVFTRKCLGRTARIFLTYTYGAFLTCTLTSMLKILVGRLRPHFMDLCKPNYTMPPVIAEPRFITEYECTNPLNVPDKWIKNLYWSFPSGHSSTAAFSCVFMIIYLEFKLKGAKTPLLFKAVIQGLLFAFALVSSFSRVRDYKHHWSDVSAGFGLGVIISLWLAVTVVKPLVHERLHSVGTSELLPDSVELSDKNLRDFAE